jgi:hypothetical protein
VNDQPAISVPPRRLTLRLTTMLVVIGIPMAGWLASGLLLRSSKCGGNSAALHVCTGFAALVAETAQGKPGIRLVDLDGSLASRHLWRGFISADEFLVAPPESVIDPSRRDVVIVCKTAFGNVPQPFLNLPFWRNWAHAVGYSNGESELISPAEYARLDLSGFVPADEWLGR